MFLNNYNLDPNFWRNKNVLITGAHGFVGKNLSDQ
jgi:FlaA1/EpsC-like NDP-sugar epimerase